MEIKKLFYSMGEVSEMFDVNPSLIRYWESQFDALRPKKNKKGNRLFRPEDVDLERGVIVEEIGMYEDTPEDLVSEILAAAIYPSQPLGRPILGTQGTLQAIDSQALSDYCRKQYDDCRDNYSVHVLCPFIFPQSSLLQSSHRLPQTHGADRLCTSGCH